MTPSNSSETPPADVKDLQLLGESKYLLAFEGLCEHASEDDLYRQYQNPERVIQLALMDSFTGFHPEVIIAQLQQTQAMLSTPEPLPQHWRWQAGSAQPMALLDSFENMERADEKTTTLFLQCLQQRRKSKKYLTAMQAVFEKYPQENALFDLLMTYFLRWDLNAARDFFQAHVAGLRAPLLGRFASAAATFWSLDSDAQLTPEREALFRWLMQDRYTLEAHLEDPETIPTFDEALGFYKAVSFWYGQQRQLPLFVFALNQLHALEQEQAALMFLLARDSLASQPGLKETLGQNYLATTRRLLQWFFYTLLDDMTQLQALRQFMEPLWKREQRWSAGL